jgi:leucyl/phenylalanyl-tRNA--protein transferase
VRGAKVKLKVKLIRRRDCERQPPAAYTRPMISAELLLHAYRNAVFPMSMQDGEIAWFSPDPRAIIPIHEFHVPHGLRRTLKKARFEIRIDTAFETVMRKCGARRETWINDEIVASYVNLHRLGYAHSVESWLDGKLAGGLYGVALGGAFFGESMFHEVTDASKVALHALVMRLKERRFELLDTQWTTSHLETFGATEISRAEYRRRLDACVKKDCSFVEVLTADEL